MQNKYSFIALLSLTLLWSACGLLSPQNTNTSDSDWGTTKTENPTTPSHTTIEKVDTIKWNVAVETTETPTQKDPEIEEEEAATLTQLDTIGTEEIAEIPQEKILKDHYTIVIMMPFLGQQFTSYGPIPPKAKTALEFYEGARMAINDLQSLGVPMTVYNFDTQFDENVVKSLLDSGPLYNADLIIGPLNKKNCQLVAEFARRNAKVMVSPYNYLSTITEQNPFYVQANPSMQTKFVEMLRYIKEKNGTTSMTTIMYPEGKTATKKRVEEIQNANYIVNESANARLREYQFNIANITKENPLNTSEFLVEGQENVVIIPSRDPGFVAFCMRELSPLRNTHNIQVIGLPQWADDKFEKLDYNYYENMNLLLGSEAHVNFDDPKVRDFVSRYASEYNTAPTENVFKGYDMLMYFGEMLGKYGAYFPAFLPKNKGNTLHTTFDFQPVYGVGSSGTEGAAVIKRFENNYINILEFNDYRFRKVN